MTKKQHAPDEAFVDAPVAPAADDDEAAGFTLEAYWEQRRDLEAQLAALEARRVARPRFPRWVYDATEAPQVVASPAARDALGPGWQVHPVGEAAA